MHIPDGVISPSTSAAAAAVMIPVWITAGRKVRLEMGAKRVPVLALGSAFCFAIMLFNVPAPGGATAHPVAGTLLAILLGPWAACIGVSVTLAIQALLFGDGGVLTYPANCFTMAFVLPFVGYTVYKFLSSRLPSTITGRSISAGLGSYIGINAAAAIVGLLLGIQPHLFHTSDGRALYFPFGLSVTMPAMLGAHLLMAGPAEAVVTAVAIRFLLTSGYALYGSSPQNATAARRLRTENILIALLAFLALSPLGLLANGNAFGEWGASDVKTEIAKREGRGYVPAGFANAEKGYHGVSGLKDYGQPATGTSIPGYLAAGVTGSAIILLLLLFVGRALVKREDENSPAHALPVPYSGTLPDWLSTSSDAAKSLDSNLIRNGSINHFLERNLASLTDSAAVTMRTEKLAHQPGMLQRIDPRAKVLGFLSLILAASFSQSIAVLLCLAALSVLLAALSRLSPVRYLSRVWFTAPLFTAAIALPAMLNIVTPGKSLILLSSHPYLAVTMQGVREAVLLTVRVGAAVSFGVLLTLTTPWIHLLSSLRSFKVSRLFVSTLGMAYRYLTQLTVTAAEMFTARRSRQVGRVTDSESRIFSGSAIGSLFHRTMAHAEEVYDAMLARGYKGEAPVLEKPYWRITDTLWLIFTLFIAFAAMGSEYLHA